MMYLCVQLKVCEGCGSLWFQAEQGGVYCERCVRRLKDFPAPGSRRLRRLRSHSPKKDGSCTLSGGAA
jgi:hypothetical protein